MKKVKIDPYQLAETTISSSTLLVSKGQGKINVMALDWKSIGELWMIPVCTIAVARSRYTFSLLNETPEFTLNVPSPEISSTISIAGSFSGRTTDKIAKAGLTLTPSRYISVPMITEAMISYECKIIHTAESGNICSTHCLFFGEILAAYADESLLK
ncbi:MAG: flavin reductase family protein [Candidatus Helarchaeota archaeon]